MTIWYHFPQVSNSYDMGIVSNQYQYRKHAIGTGHTSKSGNVNIEIDAYYKHYPLASTTSC